MFVSKSPLLFPPFQLQYGNASRTDVQPTYEALRGSRPAWHVFVLQIQSIQKKKKRERKEKAHRKGIATSQQQNSK